MVNRKDLGEVNRELEELWAENEKLKEEIKELNRLIDELREDQFKELPF